MRVVYPSRAKGKEGSRGDSQKFQGGGYNSQLAIVGRSSEAAPGCVGWGDLPSRSGLSSRSSAAQQPVGGRFSDPGVSGRTHREERFSERIVSSPDDFSPAFFCERTTPPSKQFFFGAERERRTVLTPPSPAPPPPR